MFFYSYISLPEGNHIPVMYMENGGSIWVFLRFRHTQVSYQHREIHPIRSLPFPRFLQSHYIDMVDLIPIDHRVKSLLLMAKSPYLGLCPSNGHVDSNKH